MAGYALPRRTNAHSQIDHLVSRGGGADAAAFSIAALASRLRDSVARGIGGAHLEGVGAADQTGVPCRRHTGAEGGGIELALGDSVWLRGESERCVLPLRGSLGPEEADGGRLWQRGVSGWRELRLLGAVDDFVGRLAALYDLAVQDVADDVHVQ